MKRILFLMLLAGMPVVAADANLITNGSFESLVTSTPGLGVYAYIHVGSTDITGWVVTRAQIDLVDWYWQASDGMRSLDLNGSPGVGGIAQAFATVPGQSYEVQFDQAANPDLGASPGRISHMGVQAAGQSAEYAFDSAGRTLQDMGWVTRTWQFVAVDTATTLEFYSMDWSTPNNGPALDNVIVTSASSPATIPIPSAGLLAGGGMAAVSWLRRRGTL